jgi:hypothetical protein
VKRIGFIACLIVGLLGVINAQETRITQEEMYEDFDYLVSLIETTNPYLDIKQKHFGYNILDTITTFRAEVEECRDFNDFIFLMKKVTNTCIDGHTYVVTPAVYPTLNLFLPIVYDRGEYLLKEEFTYNSKTFKAGAKLISINGNPNIHEEVAGQVPYRYMMRWDNDLQHFYSQDFYLSDQYLQERMIALGFEQDGKVISETFEFDQAIEKAGKPFAEDNARIEYFEENGILYIRIPAMAWHLRNHFKKEIPKVTSGKEITAVVIDVRYNYGGSSVVARNVMRLIIGEALVLPTNLYGNTYTQVSKKYIRQHRLDKEGIINTLPELDLAKQNFVTKEEIIKPYRKSIKHDGPIYIIGNEHIYSAGGAMFMFANLSKTDKIYSIGTPTGWFLGEFTDPIHYELPNSKIEVAISPTMSMTNVAEAGDIMLDSYDYTIYPTLQDYQELNQQEDTLYNEQYLLNNDPYFKPILKNLKQIKHDGD